MLFAMLCKPAPLDSVLGRLVGSIGGVSCKRVTVCMQSKHAVSGFLMGLGTVQTGEPP